MFEYFYAVKIIKCTTMQNELNAMKIVCKLNWYAMWIKIFLCNTYHFERDFHLLYNQKWTITGIFLVNNKAINKTESICIEV